MNLEKVTAMVDGKVAAVFYVEQGDRATSEKITRALHLAEERAKLEPTPINPRYKVWTYSGFTGWSFWGETSAPLDEVVERFADRAIDPRTHMACARIFETRVRGERPVIVHAYPDRHMDTMDTDDAVAFLRREGITTW